MNTHDFAVTATDGTTRSLRDYAGRALLIVNVASKCGLTPQYEGLEALYREAAPRGLEILGFPCNQFGGQEPGTDAEIQDFCSTTFDVTFPIFSKIDVNGPNADPLFTYLRAQAPDDLGPTSGLHEHIKATRPEAPGTDEVKWNFTKFQTRPGPGRSGAAAGPGTTAGSGCGYAERRGLAADAELLQLENLSPSRAVAEETVQETWLSVLRGLDGFRGMHRSGPGSTGSSSTPPGCGPPGSGERCPSRCSRTAGLGIAGADPGAGAVALDGVHIGRNQPCAGQRLLVTRCWDGPFGAVIPLEAPSELMAEPRTIASAGWPLRRPSDSRSSTRRPTPPTNRCCRRRRRTPCTAHPRDSPGCWLKSTKMSGFGITVTPPANASVISPGRCPSPAPTTPKPAATTAPMPAR